jgi:hypothetical protein
MIRAAIRSAHTSAMVCLLGASVAAPPALLEAQEAGAQPPSTVEITGPPPPTSPEVVSRDPDGMATVRATRVATPLSIDGVLDEAFYEDTAFITDFVQSGPGEGTPATERTDVWIAFDDENVYVSARNWDSAPESEWVANEMRRDTNQLRQNQTFGVMFDTFYDRRNGVMFYTNPLGALAEFQITNEGNPNSDWNPIWDVRTGRFDGGWTVEMAIPFKSLRYRPGRDQVWGLQLRRAIRRKNEWTYLTPIPLSVSGGGAQGSFRVSLSGTLVGIEAPPQSRVVEIKPYAISGLETDLTASPTVQNDGYLDAGLDAKIGITENLTADLTFNTDFAQVEVDEQQVNLTRFNLFFPEKREFFLEGQGIFNFAPGISAGGGPGGGGGGAPTLFYSRRIGLEGGQPVPIVGGGRVTGKVGSFDVGALSIQTDGVGADIESTNFSVLRLRRDILARSAIGVLLENRSQSVRADGSNQTYGIDGSFAFGDNVSMVTYYARTRTEGLDGNDESYRGRFNYDGDTWGGGLDHILVGDDFNPEIGFVRRGGIRQSSVSGRFSPRPASIDWIRQVSLQTSLSYVENERLGYVESRDRGGSFSIELENSDAVNLQVTENHENLLEPDFISGVQIPAGRYAFTEFSASYNFGLQRPYSGRLSYAQGGYFTGDRKSVGFTNGRVEITPRLSLEPSLEFNWIDLAEASFDQHVARSRVSFSLSPRMYVSGLLQYSTGNDVLSGNFRFRWEWAPGSEIFVVYTEDRDTNPLEPASRWSELSNRGLVVKVNRLFRL